MCSIIGYCGICDDLDEFQKGFDKTISRDRDDSRIVDTGNGLLIPQTCDHGATGSIRDAAKLLGNMWYAMERFSI